jgi:hypothetical protein
MMVKVACNSCGHAGIANSSTLPRELQCSRCGDRRHVAPKDCARIRNRVAVMERILDEAELVDAAGGG